MADDSNATAGLRSSTSMLLPMVCRGHRVPVLSHPCAGRRDLIAFGLIAPETDELAGDAAAHCFRGAVDGRFVVGDQRHL